MNVEQILEQLPKLAPEERRRIFELLAKLESENPQILTSEESCAIDETIRSLEAGKSVSASEIRQRFGGQMVAVIYAPEAEHDLETITAFTAKDNPRAAEHFGCCLIERAELLGAFPMLGHSVLGKPNVACC
jgi:ParE toxin of type II toxin-antitoxin system, parDE